MAGVSEIGPKTTIKVWRGQAAGVQDEGDDNGDNAPKVSIITLVVSSTDTESSTWKSNGVLGNSIL